MPAQRPSELRGCRREHEAILHRTARLRPGTVGVVGLALPSAVGCDHGRGNRITWCSHASRTSLTWGAWKLRTGSSRVLLRTIEEPWVLERAGGGTDTRQSTS